VSHPQDKELRGGKEREGGEPLGRRSGVKRGLPVPAKEERGKLQGKEKMRNWD